MVKKSITTFAAAGFLAISGIAVSAAPDRDQVPLTISGCVVAGEAKDSFLLTNVQIDGSAVAPAHAFYRFSSSKELKNHVGERVEVKGKADFTDMDKGKVKVRVDDEGRATTEIRSERRSVKVNDYWFGTMDAVKLDAEVPTYKFEVAQVKRLEGNCASSGVVR
jgi:hypothetical protein